MHQSNGYLSVLRCLSKFSYSIQGATVGSLTCSAEQALVVKKNKVCNKECPPGTYYDHTRVLTASIAETRKLSRIYRKRKHFP